MLRLKRNADFNLSSALVASTLAAFIISLFISFKTVSCITYAEEIKPLANNINKLEELEEKIFYQKYTKESLEDRISRLELFIYGKRKEKEELSQRINNIITALEKKENIPEPLQITPESVLRPEVIELPKEPTNKEQNIEYNESSKSGVVGAVEQLEKDLFGVTYDNKPFQNRIEALEKKLLTSFERIEAVQKSLLERVTYLIKKSHGTKENRPIVNPGQLNQNNIEDRTPASYTIDPSTGFLINQITGEIAKDRYGNPISVKMPSQYQPQEQIFGYPSTQNPYIPQLPYGNNPYGSQTPPALPPEFFLQQDQFNDTGDNNLGF